MGGVRLRYVNIQGGLGLVMQVMTYKGIGEMGLGETNMKGAALRIPWEDTEWVVRGMLQMVGGRSRCAREVGIDILNI